MLKQIRLKTVARLAALIIIVGTAGCASLHSFNSDTAESTDEVSKVTENVYSISTKMMPKEHEKLRVLTKSIDEEYNKVKRIKENFTIDPKIQEEMLRKKMEQIKPLQGLFETTLQTEKADDKISINFALKNISGEVLNISHGSGQQFDIWVYNEQNEEVYKWSNNKAFTQALIARELDKLGQLTFSEEWNLEDSMGIQLPTGKYTIEVRIMIRLESGNITPDELVAKSIVYIERGGCTH